jgi:LytS/YehU family sensor histidine kinase
VVENAIYHGLSKQLAATRLLIQAQRQGDVLRLSVYNDGPALPADFDLTFSTGLGLTNIVERLSQFYPDRLAMKKIKSCEQRGRYADFRRQ